MLNELNHHFLPSSICSHRQKTRVPVNFFSLSLAQKPTKKLQVSVSLNLYQKKRTFTIRAHARKLVSHYTFAIELWKIEFLFCIIHVFPHHNAASITLFFLPCIGKWQIGSIKVAELWSSCDFFFLNILKGIMHAKSTRGNIGTFKM